MSEVRNFDEVVGIAASGNAGQSWRAESIEALEDGTGNWKFEKEIEKNSMVFWIYKSVKNNEVLMIGSDLATALVASGKLEDSGKKPIQPVETLKLTIKGEVVS